MSTINYVCRICTQNFTRRYSANRHNSKFHPHETSVVRLLDYLVGVSAGTYPSPNPLVHPRYTESNPIEQSRNRSHSNAAALNPNGDFFHLSGLLNPTDKKSTHVPHPQQRNINQQQSPLNPSVPVQNKPRTKDDPFSIFDRYQEPADKILEIKKCLRKFGSVEDVRSIIKSCWGNFALTGNCTSIDNILINARRISRWNYSIKELNSTS